MKLSLVHADLFLALQTPREHMQQLGNLAEMTRKARAKPTGSEGITLLDELRARLSGEKTDG